MLASGFAEDDRPISGQWPSSDGLGKVVLFKQSRNASLWRNTIS